MTTTLAAPVDAPPAPGTISLTNVEKRFGETLALDRVSLRIGRGERVALLGENGAGKSTLMKVLYGFYKADAGEIALDGRPLEIHSPADARKHGIFMVLQEFSLLPELTVLENLLLFHPKTKGLALLRRKSPALLPPEALATLARLLPKLDFSVRVGDLDVGSVQLLEIAKAVMCNPSLLILDEPSSVLGEHELALLWEHLAELAASGVSIVLITHKIADVKACADRIVVMRRGRWAAEFPPSISERDLLREMLPAESADAAARAPASAGTPGALRYEVSAAGCGRWRDVSLQVRAGEILGIAGISGSGQVELGELLSGAVPLEAGRIAIDGVDVTGSYHGIYSGVGYVPQHPRHNAIASELFVADNLLLRDVGALPWTFDLGKIAGRVPAALQAGVTELGIRPARMDIRAGGLSGGNVQKLAVARELAYARKVIVVVYPTMGLDLGTQALVLGALQREAQRGAAVIVVHEEIDKLLELCERILVVAHYEIVATVESARASAHDVLALMTGETA